MSSMVHYKKVKVKGKLLNQRKLDCMEYIFSRRMWYNQSNDPKNIFSMQLSYHLLGVLVYPVGDLVVNYDKGNRQSEGGVLQQRVGVVLWHDHPCSSFITRHLDDAVDVWLRIQLCPEAEDRLPLHCAVDIVGIAAAGQEQMTSNYTDQ